MTKKKGEDLGQELTEAEETTDETVSEVEKVPDEVLALKPEEEQPPAPEFDIKAEFETLMQKMEEQGRHFQSVTDSATQKTANEARRQLAQVTLRQEQLEASMKRVQDAELAGLDPEERGRREVQILRERLDAMSQPTDAQQVKRALLREYPEINYELLKKGVDLNDSRLQWVGTSSPEESHAIFMQSLEAIQVEPEKKKVEPEDVKEVTHPPDAVPVETQAPAGGSTTLAELEKRYIEDPQKWGPKYKEAREKEGL